MQNCGDAHGHDCQRETPQHFAPNQGEGKNPVAVAGDAAAAGTNGSTASTAIVLSKHAGRPDTMLDTALVLPVIAGLLVVVGISQPLAIRLRLPPSVLLAAVGVGIGAFPAVSGQLGLSGSVDAAAGSFAALPVSSVTFIYVFLPLLVFEAGIATHVRRSIDDAAAILFLAVIATLITTAVVGVALWPFTRVPLVVCLLLGAVVATTDPAAVIAIFRDVAAPVRLTRLVEGEALLNDAAAISLFVVLLGIILTGREPSAIAGLRRGPEIDESGGVTISGRDSRRG